MGVIFTEPKGREASQFRAANPNGLLEISLKIGLFWSLVFAACYGFAVWAPHEDGSQERLILNLFYFGGPLGCLALYAFQRRSAPPERRGSQRWWSTILLLGGVVLAMAGDAVMETVLLLKFKVNGPNAISDSLFVTSCLLLVAGVNLVPRSNVLGKTRVRMLMDSTMVSLTLGAVAWYFLVGPAVLRGFASATPDYMGLVYPALDLIMACTIGVIWLQGGASEGRSAFRYLFAGLAVLLIGDTLYTFQSLFGKWSWLGQYLDISWQLSFMLVALGTIAVRNGPQSSIRVDSRVPSLVQSILPNATIPLLFSILGFGVWTNADKRLLIGVVIAALLTTCVLTIRQIAALFETRAVNSELAGANDQLKQQAGLIEEHNSELKQLNGELDAAFRQLSRANRKLSALATTDGLTGLANQRAFQARLEEEVARATRLNAPLSVLMIDVDHFKQYNDTYGHPAGDVVLKQVGGALRKQLRKGDFLARYGGEEFVVILPNTSEDTASLVAERMREAVQHLATAHRPVTASFGSAQYDPRSESSSNLLEWADFALYSAKRRGRNRLVRYSEVPRIVAECPSIDAPVPLHCGIGRGGQLGKAVELACSVGHHGFTAEQTERTVEALLATLELRGVEDLSHVERVTWISLRLAMEMHRQRKLDLTPNLVRQVTFGAIMHDLGKVGISDFILHKSGKLDEYEMAMVKRHPAMGASIVSRFPELADAVPVVLHHHERWNGTGYPDRLEGESIPQSARICSVADAFDAMTSNRSYQDAMSIGEALIEMQSLAGNQFDPHVVSSLTEISVAEWDAIRAGNFQAIEDSLAVALDTLKRSA